ncbi:hypothetical protein KAW43_01830 [Candidatus Parcubacteria bacterium]|nr:hypothetical protein [Candidatus Parcubacteria bacterium]
MDKKVVIVVLLFLAIGIFILIAPQAEALYYEETTQTKGVKYAYTFYSSDTVFVHGKISAQGISGRAINTSAVLSFEKEPKKTDLTFKHKLTANQSKKIELAQYARYTASLRSAALGINVEHLVADSFLFNAGIESPTLNTQSKFFGENSSRSWNFSTRALYENQEISWTITP